MEYAIHPLGGSGEQWDTWEAMFSPADPVTGYPRPMFDARTGVIDHEVVEHWSKFDITRMVTQDWKTFGPIVTGRVRLVVGSKDSFFLERAVGRFTEKTRSLPGWDHGDGYVRIVEGADHGTVLRHTGRTWPGEISRFLEGSMEERR